MSRRRKIILASLAAGLTVAAVATVKHFRWHVFPKRFRVVEAGQLYRGGFSKPGPLRDVIEEYGIKTIVNLAADKPDGPPSQRVIDEKRIAGQYNVAYRSFRLPGDGVGDFDTLEAAAGVLAEVGNRPVFFHCAGGEHRTNAVLAVMRMKYQGWTLDQALAEIDRYGFHPKRHAKLGAHLRRYYEERIGGAASRPASQPAKSGDLAAMLPADCLFVYEARPAPGSAASRDLTSLIQGIRLLDLTSPDSGMFLDLVELLSVLGQYPYCVGVMSLDVQPRERPGSYKLRRMQLAVVVRTGTDHQPVISQMAAMVRRHSSTQTAQIVDRRVGPHNYSVLRDHRLPAWCETQFGPAGECYLVGFGAGSLERVFSVADGEAASLADDPWHAEAGRQTRTDEAILGLYGNVEALRSRLEPIMAGRPEQVVEALGLADLRRFRWGLGFEGNQHRSLLWMGRREGDFLVRLSDPASFPRSQVEVVPKEATGYSITELDVPWLAARLSQAVLASLRPDTAQALRGWWKEMEAQKSLSFERDVVAHLGPHMIIHNYPRAIEGMPLFFTVYLQHDGSPLVAIGIDKLFSYWQERLERDAKLHPGRSVAWRCEKNPSDGTWFIRTGVLSVHAVAVTDRYIVISWSQLAVRQNVAHLAKR